MNSNIIAAVVVFVLAALAAALFLFPVNTLTGNASSSVLPSFATKNAVVMESYQFAVDNPEALNGINCYCGCMQHLHDGRIHSRGLLDCHIKPDGTFDEHAANCDMCIKDTLKAKALTAQGLTKDQINAQIGAQYIR